VKQVLAYLAGLTGLLQVVHGAAATGVTNAITRIGEVKALTGEEIRQGRAVQLRGVVTARLCRLFIMQDGDSGIFVYPRLARMRGCGRVMTMSSAASAREAKWRSRG
jgi:hypothetical protein